MPLCDRSLIEMASENNDQMDSNYTVCHAYLSQRCDALHWMTFVADPYVIHMPYDTLLNRSRLLTVMATCLCLQIIKSFNM